MALVNYLAETVKLEKLIKITSTQLNTDSYMLGFRRYELRSDINRTSTHHFLPMKNTMVAENVQYTPICLGETGHEEPYVLSSGTMHQAMFMLTQAQVLRLHSRCNFLNHSFSTTKRVHLPREYMSSLSLFASDEFPLLRAYEKNQCWMHSVIPPDKLELFIVQHYYHTRRFSFQDDKRTTMFDIRKTMLLKSFESASNVSCWDNYRKQYGAY